MIYKEYEENIKGKIHFYKSIKVLINKKLQSSWKEIYYEEIIEILKNIFSLWLKLVLAIILFIEGLFGGEHAIYVKNQEW